MALIKGENSRVKWDRGSGKIGLRSVRLPHAGLPCSPNLISPNSSRRIERETGETIQKRRRKTTTRTKNNASYSHIYIYINRLLMMRRDKSDDQERRGETTRRDDRDEGQRRDN